MLLSSLKPVFEASSPLYGALFDATRSEPDSQRELESRWSDLSNDLQRQEAPLEVIERLKTLFFEPTHFPGLHGRLVVLADAVPVLDMVLPSPPVASSAFYAAAPPLLAALSALESTVTALVVEVDRSGAFFTWLDSSHGKPVMECEDFDGGHEVIHKVHSGGWSHRKLHARAEDSWERNAQACAEELLKLSKLHNPDLVILGGDVRARALVKKHLPAVLSVWEIEGSRRNEGFLDPIFESRIKALMDDFRLKRRIQGADRFSQALSSHQAVTGLGPTLESLRLGQVEVLVLAVDEFGVPKLNFEGVNLWVSSDPRQVALRHSDLSASASLGITEMPADAALVRALLAEDASCIFISSDTISLEDSVGAILRWPR